MKKILAYKRKENALVENNLLILNSLRSYQLEKNINDEYFKKFYNDFLNNKSYDSLFPVIRNQIKTNEEWEFYHFLLYSYNFISPEQHSPRHFSKLQQLNYAIFSSFGKAIFLLALVFVPLLFIITNIIISYIFLFLLPILTVLLTFKKIFKPHVKTCLPISSYIAPKKLEKVRRKYNTKKIEGFQYAILNEIIDDKIKISLIRYNPYLSKYTITVLKSRSFDSTQDLEAIDYKIILEKELKELQEKEKIEIQNNKMALANKIRNIYNAQPQLELKQKQRYLENKERLKLEKVNNNNKIKEVKNLLDVLEN